MINAYRRGIQAASEQIHKHQTNLPAEEVKMIGKRTFADMKQAGYAHIEPENEFIEGFTKSFSELQYNIVIL